MTKIFINPYYSNYFFKKSLPTFFLQNHFFKFSDMPKFSSVIFSINMPKGSSTNYNITRSIYLLYVITGSKPFFSTNKRSTTTTVIVSLSGNKMFSTLSFFFFLASSEKFRMISSSSSSNNAVDFSFHDPSSIFDFRDCRFDYHNFPFKVRVSFAFSSVDSSYYSCSNFKNLGHFNINLLLHGICFPRFFYFLFKKLK